MKEKNDLEGVQEMSIDQLHMYQLTPKKTFKKKTKPPLGIVIFKVITQVHTLQTVNHGTEGNHQGGYLVVTQKSR